MKGTKEVEVMEARVYPAEVGVRSSADSSGRSSPSTRISFVSVTCVRVASSGLMLSLPRVICRHRGTVALMLVLVQCSVAQELSL